MIRITRVSVVEYEVKDQDLDYYKSEELFNTDQIALKDLKDLKDESFAIEEVDGGSVEHTWTVVIVDDEDNSREPNPDNKERDLEIFPIQESEKTGEDAPGDMPDHYDAEDNKFEDA